MCFRVLLLAKLPSELATLPVASSERRGSSLVSLYLKIAGIKPSARTAYQPIVLGDQNCCHTVFLGISLRQSAQTTGRWTARFGSTSHIIQKVGRSGTWGIFAKIRRIGKVAMFLRRKRDGAALDCRLMTRLYTNRTMKKQKLHLIAKIAALSIVGTMPVLVSSDANAQDSLPPIVQGVQSSKLPVADATYSYTRDAKKPLVPTFVMEKETPPPIVSGRASTLRKSDESKSAEKGLLAPIGTGVVKQVAGALEPGKLRIARAFSPAKMPVRTQGSSTRSAPVPAVQIPSPISVREPQLFAPPSDGMIQGSDISPMAPPIISGSLITPSAQNPTMQPGPVTAPNYFDASPQVNAVTMQSVVSGCGDCGTSGCSSCQTGGCDGSGSCDSCGPGGCYNKNQINCDYGTYGSVSAARRYAYLEYLYLTREDGDITNSNFNPLGEFDFGSGIRLTFGQRSDMTQGREISYFGAFDIETEQTTNDSLNRLNALFAPGGGLFTSDLSAFNNASQHIQAKETSLHSLEYNRVRWGWDVLKSFIGARYIYMDDQYQLNSTAPTFGGTETGIYRLDTLNHLLGAHIGAELFYDIGYRFSLSGVSKFGLYANVNKGDVFLQNDDTVILNTESNDAAFSTTYDLSLLAHYQIRQSARLRFGYNAFYLSNVATVSDNFTPFVSPFTGFDSSDEDDAFIHGFSFGLEIYR
jgi:hypothetical protein